MAMDAPSIESFDHPITAVVQGASRGLGLAFSRQLAATPNVDNIVATCRNPAGAKELQSLVQSTDTSIKVIDLDVTDEDSISRAAREAAAVIDELHLLLNVAGILHDRSRGMSPEKKLADLQPASAVHAFRTNSLGPMLVCKHFAPFCRHPRRSVIGNLSARVGSIGDNNLGGWYSYRASKAAQNMFTRTMAIEMDRFKHMGETICVGLHPGTVDTELSRPFQANVPDEKLFSAPRAAHQLLEVIDGLDPDDSGGFFAWNGDSIPW